MLILHQLHRLRPGADEAFETLVRDRWLPAVAAVEGCRLAWFAVPTPAARWSDEVASITRFDDAAAFERFGAAVRAGELATLAAEIRTHRTGVETRLMRPLDYDPWSSKGTEVPAAATEGAPVAYMHDFVPPVVGQMNGYVDMMREKYMALTDQDLSGVVLRASWQTVAGGGPLPEMFNLSEIRDVDALLNLLTFDIPREYKSMGTWMWEALAVRDQWTTRLLRSSTWSPVK